MLQAPRPWISGFATLVDPLPSTPGVLQRHPILTTNLISKIDQAISSRIPLILHYRRLGKREIQNIFKINIDRLQQVEKQQSDASGEQPLIVVESDILQFASDHCDAHPKGKGAWNGRQIRKAFGIAAALARADVTLQPPDFQPQLRYSHFKQVEKLMAEYVDFRQHILGKNDSQLALEKEERDDDYEIFRAVEEEEGAERSQRARFDYGGQARPPVFPASMARSRMAFIPQQGPQYMGLHMGVAGGANMGYVIPGQEASTASAQPMHQTGGSPWMNVGHHPRAV
ncbi:hypothetical protein ACJ41O_010374 [Fusarium nematophilum]